MIDEAWDVIVVGAGGSGLAAACSAAEQGGRVLVLEKEPQPGGTTGIAVGSFTAAETRWQQRAGIADKVADHAADAGKFATAEIEAQNNEPLRRFFLEQAGETLDWLAGLGLSFVGPHPEPPNRVPRMHNVVPGAKAYIAALQLALQKHGGRILCEAEVTRLVRENGRVAGVQAEVAGRTRPLVARRGVILAAGDYAANERMIARFKGDRFRRIEGINPFAQGGGHRLAEAAGGRLMNMEITYGPELRLVPGSKRPFQQWLPATGPAARWMGRLARFAPGWLMRAMIKRLLVTWQHPEDALFADGAILLNREGRRFVDETTWPDREVAVAGQTDKLAFILIGGNLAERYSAWPNFISTAPDIAYAYVQDYRRLRPEVTFWADSISAAAGQCGLPPQAVEETVSRFNAYVRRETTDPHGRSGDRRPIEGKPVVVLGPVKAYFTTTEGGVAINERLQVLDQQGQVIAGLYAVGQNGLGGMILWGHGLHIAWAMTSGRLAGRQIMQVEVR